jgi:GAF domain-containing protein
MLDHHDIAESLLRAAREINTARDLHTTLNAITTTAVRSLSGINHAGISIAHRHGKGPIETIAATDPLVEKLDGLQYELGEGPCIYALEVGAVTVVERARHEQRWPRYIPAAVQMGLRAQMGLRLYIDDHTFGGLNLYSTQADEFHPDTVHTAELFAIHAALALGKAREADQLNQALATRSEIGKAIGILMVKHAMSDERAFHYLARVSSQSNVKLRDVAAEVIAQQERLANGDG